MNNLFIASTREYQMIDSYSRLPLNSLSSSVFSEWVSAGKYPSYAAYQKRVGMFLPFPDTFIRSIYYNLLASKETKTAVEEQVWGDKPKIKGE